MAVNFLVFSFMPFYPTTLNHMPMMTIEVCTKLCDHMFNAFQYLHKNNLAHMDVKPENICISTAGDFILIDLESMTVFGNPSH